VSAPERPVRALLIEDDPWVAKVNRALVEAEPGFEVIAVAGTLREGRELTRALDPELLLVDVYLPDGSGLDLVRRFREEGRAFDAILITAASDLDSVRRALRSGALDYLIKPFERARLHEALCRYRSRVCPVEPRFTQECLDHFLGHSGEGILPKGLDPRTLAQVREALAASDCFLSAEEVGARVGLSRVSAWRYLEYLGGSGTIESETVHGGVGRPAKRYRLRGGTPV